MKPETVIDISGEALLLMLKLSLPLLLVALIVGSIVSLVQALTQIQEPTLTFVPKLLAIFIALFFMMNYMGSLLSDFSENLMSMIINLE